MEEFVQSRADAISESSNGARAYLDKLRTARQAAIADGDRSEV